MREGCGTESVKENHSFTSGECTVCGKEEEIADPCASGHDFTGSWLSDATHHWKKCMREGCDVESVKENHSFSSGECTVCGKEEEIADPCANGHDMEWIETSPASYISAGIETYTCKRIGCDHTAETRDNPDDPQLPVTSITGTDPASLESVLESLPDNDADDPYTILLNVNDLGGDVITTGSVGNTLINNDTKFVNLDMSGSSLTSIENSAFAYNHYFYTEAAINLVGITIPDSVTSIGALAFASCTSLASVIIPDSVTSIGYAAFSGCTSLASIIIPDSVTSIGGSAFSGCTSLASITIPDSVTSSIGNYAFYGCTSLASISIGNSVTSIGDNAFSGCTSLASITIPDSVTSIGGDAFEGCTSLESVIIPDSVTSIGVRTFGGCTSLASVSIGNSVTSIRVHAFSGCTSLASITIPDSVTSIEEFAFSGCTSLASVTVLRDNSVSITELGYGGFLGDGGSLANENLVIYVPANSVADYKAAENWNDPLIVDRIVAIP